MLLECCIDVFNERICWYARKWVVMPPLNSVPVKNFFAHTSSLYRYLISTRCFWDELHSTEGLLVHSGTFEDLRATK